ncbi:hypothetical protein RMCBS344292_18144 [Rhizopus microsporus]|nr:hypothetical protein RMCBS344292_18144 [Rhizopus microsporus]
MAFEEIAQRLHVSRYTVSCYCDAWGIMRLVHLSGWPAVLNETGKPLIKRIAITSELKTGVEVHQLLITLYATLTYFTILNALKAIGLKAHPKRKVPFLSKKHREEYLNWALAYRSWTIHDWQKVIFSDESKTNVWGSDGIKYYWSLSTSELQPHHVIPTVKHGGGSLMVWGCMTAHGIGYICEVYNGRMNVEDYIRILDGDLTDTLNYYNLCNEDLIFQYDNDPRHTAKVTKNYLHEQKKYTVPSWPA